MTNSLIYMRKFLKTVTRFFFFLNVYEKTMAWFLFFFNILFSGDEQVDFAKNESRLMSNSFEQ